MIDPLQSTHFVVVTYNGEPFIEKCINAIQEESPSSPIHAIDNGSVDNTLSILDSLGVSPIKTNENLGFGKANNIGISRALSLNAEHVFLINQDAYLEKGSLLRFFEKPESNQTALHAFIQLNGIGDRLDSKFSSHYLTEAYCPDFLDDLYFNTLKSTYISKFVNAAAWLIPKALLLKVGGFNPSFFHYGEDDNYVHRLHHHGYELMLHPDCKVHHDREDRPQSEFFNDTKSKERLFLQRISLPSNQEDSRQILRRTKRTYWKKRLRGYSKESIIEAIHIDFLHRTAISDIIKNRDTTKSLGPNFLKP